MYININHISSKELDKTLSDLNEQIMWSLEHKLFAQVLALRAGVEFLTAEVSARKVLNCYHVISNA